MKFKCHRCYSNRFRLLMDPNGTSVAQCLYCGCASPFGTAAIPDASGRAACVGRCPRCASETRTSAQMMDVLGVLEKAVKTRDTRAAPLCALNVALAATDLALRYRPPVEVDLTRLDLWHLSSVSQNRDGTVPGLRHGSHLAEVHRCAVAS